MAYDLGTARGKIELDYDGKKDVDAAERDMDRLKRSSKDTDGAVSKLGARLKSFAGIAGKSAGVAGLASGLGIAAVQAANLTVQIAGIVPQLASIASLSAALPGAFAGMTASVLIFKAATANVGDTLKAAFDPKKTKQFQEALDKLSPSAQQFAKAVQANVKPLQDYQKSLQESFFSSAQLAGQVPRVIKGLAQLRPLTTGLASDMGELTRKVANFALSQDSIRFLADSIQVFRAAVSNAGKPLLTLLAGLRDVGNVGLPLLLQMSDAANGVATSFGNWLTAVASDGRLQAWIDTALSTLRTLGGLVANVASIFTSIFTAAADTSGGLLENLTKITGQFAAFLKSAEGAAAIRSLFSGISALAAQLAPILTTLAGALAGALGPALKQIAEVVGPALLQVVQAIAPAFGPLAQGLADVITGVAPLLAPLGQLVGMLAQLAGGVLTSLASELGPVIALFAGAFTQALQSLAPLITQVLVQGLPIAAAAGLELAKAFAPLAPLFVQFATALAQAVLDNLPQIVSVIQQIVPLTVQLAEALGGTLGTALQTLIPMLPTLVGGFVTFLSACYKVIGVILQVDAAFVKFTGLMIGLPTTIGNAITGAINFITNGFNSVVTFLGGIITQVVTFFAGLPGKIGAALAALPGQVWNLIVNTMKQAAFLFGAGIGLLITAAVTLPPKIGAAIAALPGQIAGIISRAWSLARSLFVQGIAAVVGFSASLPGRIRSAIASLGALIGNVARSAWNLVRSAFTTGISNAVNLARSLPGRIRSAIGNLAGLLRQAAGDAIAGFVNGIRAGVGAVGDAARSLGSSVLSGIKSTLKISSPSKEMISIGRFVTQGLAKGMLGTATQVKAASNKLANMVKDAFADKLISSKAKNSVLTTLSRNTAKMLTLVNQANAVAARLKTAQTNLAAVQKQYSDTYNNAVQKTKDSFNIVSAGSGAGDLDLVRERFKQAVQQAKDFAKNIQTLTKRGLNKDLLAQLVDAGADGGGAMAAALATASNATLKEFNGLQAQLSTSASQVGKATADAMYGAGLKAAQGIVKGLQSQQKAIEAQMNKIAQSMVAAIKKALKIKSPSRIMFEIGGFTAEGLADGMKALRDKVSDAARSLATASIIPTVKLGAIDALASARAQAAAAASAAAARQAAVQIGTGETRSYNIGIGDKTFATLVVDVLTGAPVTVKKVNDEGLRRSAWAGNGRTASA